MFGLFYFEEEGYWVMMLLEGVRVGIGCELEMLDLLLVLGGLVLFWDFVEWEGCSFLKVFVKKFVLCGE